jgi:predicted ATPase
MIESLTLSSFKAFGERTTVAFRPFTLLVGPNGAGKSTVLQAIDLLGGVVRSTLPEHLHDRGWEYGDLPHLRSKTVEIEISARLVLDGEVLLWTLTLGKRRRPGVALEQVVLDPDGAALVLLDRRGRTMSRLVEGGKGTGDHEKIVQTLTSSWLAVLDPASADDQLRFPRLCRLAAWARGIHGHFFLDPVKLRSPGRGEHTDIGANGEHLAPFLAGLRRRRPAAFDALLARVKSHYPHLEELLPRRAEYGWTQLEIVERWNGESARLNARQVSDGLLRLIAVAAMQETVPPPTVLLLDEIENGLHPQLLGVFTELLQELVPQTQVVVTSHSPVAVNFVGEDQAIVIISRGRRGRPTCTRLDQVKGYAKLRPHFDPGELWYNLGEDRLVP